MAITTLTTPSSNTSRGFAFLSFRDPKVANLAIQTMSNQVLAGRPMKTGWANQSSSIAGVEITTSTQIPENASSRTQKAFTVLAQLTGSSVISPVPENASTTVSSGSGAVSVHSESVHSGSSATIEKPEPTVLSMVAEAKEVMKEVASGALAVDNAAKIAANAAIADAVAASAPTDSQSVGSAHNPTQHILVHNMFDKDTETEEGWANDLKAEFFDECSKFGKILSAIVMSEEDGGKVYASFETIEAAANCATNLAGRWFDKRQLRVEYIQEDMIPK